MPLRMRVHEREPIGLALRRFKKLLERSGIQKELRKRKYYEKPCEARRRAELRKQSAIRKAKPQETRGKPGPGARRARGDRSALLHLAPSSPAPIGEARLMQLNRSSPPAAPQ